MLDASKKRRIVIASLVLVMLLLPTIFGSSGYPDHTNIANNNQDGFNGFFSFLASLEIIIERHEKLLIVLSTIAIAWFTGTLYRATSGLLDAAEQQKSDMRESLDIAKQAADAAKDSFEITKHAFYRTHRPRLIVRWIYLVDEKTVQFEVTNIGENDAEILGAHVEVCMDNLPAKSPYTAEGDVRGLFPKFIHFGQAHEVKWQVLDDKASERFHLELGWNSAIANGRHANEAKKIYLLGYVTYQDERMHIRHRTAFCRLYDYRKRRFLPMPDADPDYEHAD